MGDRSREESPEAMFVRVFLLLRAYHLFAGALTLLFDRRRLARPRLGLLVYAGLVGETAWLARRVLRRGDFTDPTTAAVDVGAVAIGLVVCASALPADEQFNATNWMYPVSLMSGVGGAAAFTSRRTGLAATTVLGGSFAAMATLRSQRRTMAALLGLAQYYECYVAGDLLTGQVRRTGAEIARLRAEAVVLAEQRGRSEARARLQGELHAGALDALQTVQRHLVSGAQDRASGVARREAARLRRALRGEPEGAAETLRERVESVVDRFADAPIRVEVVDDGSEPQLDPAATDALCDALSTMLDWAALTDAVASRVVVALSSDDDVTEVCVRIGQGAVVTDAGMGALTARMAAVGGASVDRSSTGAALVTVRVG